jgi:protein TonB
MLRFLTVAFSLGIHAALALAFYDFEPKSAAIDEGAGDDMMVVEQGIALEGLYKAGEAQETIEAVEATPQQESAARQRLEEVKAQERPVEEAPPEEKRAEEPPPEEKPIEPEEPLPPEMKVAELPDQTEIIDSEEGPAPEALRMRTPALVEEKVEIEEVKEPQPEQLASPEQIEIVAVEEQRATGEAQRRAYFGRMAKHLERRKVNPRSKRRGSVVVEMTVDPSGKVLSRTVKESSGVKLLDDAALQSIDKSSPFPPFDGGVSSGPLVVAVPFKFVVR